MLSTFAASPSAAALGVAGMMPLLAYGLALDTQKERWEWVRKIDEATSTVALQIFGSERKVGRSRGPVESTGRRGGLLAATSTSADSFSAWLAFWGPVADGKDRRQPISKYPPRSFTSSRHPKPTLVFPSNPSEPSVKKNGRKLDLKCSALLRPTFALVGPPHAPYRENQSTG